MKKILLTMIAGLGIAGLATAQTTDKGTFITGGNVSYNYQKVVDRDGNVQDYSILPNVGYFVQDNLAVGLAVGYTDTTKEDSDKIKNVSGEFTVAPYARLYKGDGNIKFFGQLAVPMGWGTNKVDGTKTGTVENYGVALSPGIAYFPTNKLGIEFSVQGLHYQYSAVKPENGTKVEMNEFGLNVNSLKPTIGINFYF